MTDSNSIIMTPFAALYPFLTLNSLTISTAIIAYLPDVMVGSGETKSDRLKWSLYHELGHTTHYSKVGLLYWEGVAHAEILANGHGNSGSFGAGRIALTESWAEHIGLTFLDRTYGIFGSYTRPYLQLLEETKNESPNHIPIGFYHDLIDNVPDIEEARDYSDGNGMPGAFGIINDQVTGYSNTQLFNILNSNIASPTEFKDALIQGASSSTQTAVNNLFNSY